MFKTMGGTNCSKLLIFSSTLRPLECLQRRPVELKRLSHLKKKIKSSSSTNLCALRYAQVMFANRFISRVCVVQTNQLKRKTTQQGFTIGSNGATFFILRFALSAISSFSDMMAEKSYTITARKAGHTASHPIFSKAKCRNIYKL